VVSFSAPPTGLMATSGTPASTDPAPVALQGARPGSVGTSAVKSRGGGPDRALDLLKGLTVAVHQLVW